MMRQRMDCHFIFLTKRIERFLSVIPRDWNDGWSNVTIGCTCENQKRSDERLSIFLDLPIRKKVIVCEPLLERIDLNKYLNNTIDQIIAGGESGDNGRICKYEWILDIREQCIRNNISFHFKQTGTHFLKNEKLYRIKRQLQHKQAKKANIDFQPLSKA